VLPIKQPRQIKVEGYRHQIELGPGTASYLVVLGQVALVLFRPALGLPECGRRLPQARGEKITTERDVYEAGRNEGDIIRDGEYIA